MSQSNPHDLQSFDLVSPAKPMNSSSHIRSSRYSFEATLDSNKTFSKETPSVRQQGSIVRKKNYKLKKKTEVSKQVVICVISC